MNDRDQRKQRNDLKKQLDEGISFAGSNTSRSIFEIAEANGLKKQQESGLWDLVIANLKSIILKPEQRWGTLSKIISKEDLEKKLNSRGILLGRQQTRVGAPMLEIKDLPDNVQVKRSQTNLKPPSSPRKNVNLNGFVDQSESDNSPTKEMEPEMGNLFIIKLKWLLTCSL